MRLIELGRVGKPHGFRGEFVAFTDAGQESALAQASQIFLGNSSETAVRYQILGASWMPKGWKLKLNGINSDTEVNALRGHSIFLDRSELPDPPKNEYYIGDLVGCLVMDTERGSRLGFLKEVETSAAGGIDVFQDRWVISTDTGPLLVPAVQRFIERVDIERREIFLRNLSDII